MSPNAAHGPGTYARTAVIIAAYNEADAIAAVVRGLLPLFPNVIVVDDGSRDLTAKTAHSAGATVLRHPLNLGQGAALQTAITYALSLDADFIATFDADGQHRPEDLARLIDALQNDAADVATGSRFLGTMHNAPAGRRLLLQCAAFFSRVTTRLPITDAHNGLRAFSRRAAELIHLDHNRMAHASELLAQIAHHRLRLVEIPCTILYTPYSKRKGQHPLGALNILLDLFFARLFQ